MASRTRRRVVQSDEPSKFVSLTDPGLDKESSDVDAYKKSRGRDRSGLVFTEEPTEYHCVALTPDQSRSALYAQLAEEAGAGAVAQCHKAFDYGCRLISGWVFEDGTTGNLPKKDWPVQIDLFKQAEIGGYILGLSDMEDTDPKS